MFLISLLKKTSYNSRLFHYSFHSKKRVILLYNFCLIVFIKFQYLLRRLLRVISYLVKPLFNFKTVIRVCLLKYKHALIPWF